MYQIIDIYSIFPFITDFIFGLYFKNKYVLAFILGILWELFEYYIAHNSYTREMLIKYWPIPQKYWEEKNIFNKVFDLLFNMLGYHLGNISNKKI
jgi:hypothetical protein